MQENIFFPCSEAFWWWSRLCIPSSLLVNSWYAIIIIIISLLFFWKWYVAFPEQNDTIVKIQMRNEYGPHGCRLGQGTRTCRSPAPSTRPWENWEEGLLQAAVLGDSARRKATNKRAAIPTSANSGPPLLHPLAAMMSSSAAATRGTPRGQQCVPTSDGTSAATDGRCDIASSSPGKQLPYAPATQPASAQECLPKRAPADPKQTYTRKSLPRSPPACCHRRCIAAWKTFSPPPPSADVDSNDDASHSNNRLVCSCHLPISVSYLWLIILDLFSVSS